MSNSLRIALLVNPFTLHVKGGDHAAHLGREFLGMGHSVRGFGGAPGAIPRSGADGDEAAAGEESGGLAGWEPDAIVAYEALSPAAWLGARTARRLSIPLCLVEIGSRADERWRGRFFQRVGETLYGRYVRHTASTLIAVDPLARDRALRRGFAAERVTMLPAGVDLSVYRPGLASGLILRHHIRGRILLYVGQISEQRGLGVLAEAFAKTVGQRADWSLVLAGDGPARPRLRAQIDRQGIGARVHWLPRPREEELPGLVSASTLVAVPAVDDTVRGQMIPRAMACGVPVLASDRPALRHYLEHDAAGLLVAPGDVEAWVEALRRASTSPEARRRWGTRARELALERLSWTRIARVIEQQLVAAGAPAVEAPGAGGAGAAEATA